MKLDYDQSRAVRSRGHTVVSAGAGSGKTTVLTERYLSLLEEGVEVPSILTLTFTRKAAAEMHQRIYRALVSRGAENERWERALREFDDARISTLDSFTAEIARAGAAEFGIPPTFSTDERELDRICSQVATEFLFSNANNAVLSRLASERSAEQLLSEGLKELALQEMSPVRPTDFDGMIDRQIATCRELFVDTVATLEEVLSFLAKDADPGNTKTTKAIVERAAQTPAIGDLAVAELLDAVEWISEQTAPGKLKSESAQAVKENFLIAREHVHTLQECAVLLNAESELRELYTLLAGLQDKVRARKRSSGFLSFHDVMELAIAVLEHSEPVRAWYRSRISHIMIDEFQDNNERQKYLLELLSGGDGEGAGELFFVGDEKQSIYRFRGADVSVFKRLSSELSGRGGQDITLRTNYRSAPRLIRRFNSLFSLLLEGGADYEAGFSPLFDRSNAPAGDGDAGVSPPQEENPAAGGTVHRSGPALEGGPDDPQLRVFVREAGASSGNDTLVNDSGTEALFVVESIYHTVQSGRLLVDSGSGASRPVGYGDIAILMRSGANQYEYERMFRRYGIPYSSDSIRSLYLEAPANDMYSILQACLYPQDRYAWATFLRSPIVALTDDAIVSLFQADIPVAAPLPDKLARTFSSDDAARYETACELYDTLKAAADRQSIAHMLHTIWYDFGYRNLYLCDPVNHGYLEYYDFLCAQAAVYEREGLAAFLDAVRPQLGQFEKTGELTVLGRRTSGVRIMSIHRSKGLEFPVVFVVGCGSVANAGRESAGLWHRHTEQGITINLKPESGGKSGTKRRSSNIFLTQAKAQEAAEEAAELRRLLYVAMTRAESHCVLTGVWKEPSKPSDTPPRSFFELLSPLFDENLPIEWIGDRTVEERRHAGVSIPAADFSTLDRLYAEAERITFPLEEGPFTPSGLNERYRLRVPAAEGTPRPAFDCEAALDEANAHAAFGTFAHWCAAAYVEGKVTAADPSDTLLARAPARLAAALPREGRNAIATEALERACTAVDRIFDRLSAGAGGPGAANPAGGPGSGDRGVDESGASPAGGNSGARPAGGNPGAAGAHVELPFGMMLRETGEEIEVYGAIDLVFETAERPVIVDFKTDRVLSPDYYAMQMDLYRRAAREMFGGEPVVILVSMRDYEMHEMPGLDASAYEGITETAPGVNPA